MCGVACGAAALAVTGLPASGCGNRVQPAPYLDVVLDDSPSSSTYGQVAIPIAEYPQLAALGGAVTARVQMSAAPRSFFVPDGGILVVHRNAAGAADEYVAVQSLCPHQQCPLGYSEADDLVECPCHGSRFRATVDDQVAGSYLGQVTHLPARDNLSAWAVKLTAGVLRVDFRAPLSTGTSGLKVVAGLVSFTLDAVPGLAAVGGSAIVSPQGLGDTLILVRQDAATITTLSAICTHAGCKVQYDPAANDLGCPCHGSTFTMDGAVTSAPARTPLRSYPTDFDGTNVVIHVA